ncbi:TetR family transcriptional regulator [Kineococcus sp. T90]|nr:TetR family transcriptional regulator [Kineococcus indalonis]
MMIAATELMAGGGYRGASVRDICARASVSRAAFYGCFADKDDCIGAAYDRFIAVVGEALRRDDPRAGDWPSFVAGFLGAYLATLQRDPVSAFAFTVEMDALGRPARRRRREAVTGLAHLLREERERWSPGSGAAVPLGAYVAALYAARQAVADALDEDAPDLMVLLPELAGWLPRLVGDAPVQVPGPSGAAAPGSARPHGGAGGDGRRRAGGGA